MSDRLREVLRARFGHDDFQGPQRAILDHLLGGGDALVVMPTGAGKSLLYQLPALVSGKPTLVLSPLIALMKDQTDQLRARGIAASFVNSSLDRRERDERLERFLAGETSVLYVTPERFRVPEFASRITGRPLGLLAVDEAHCVTEWGHDFRPQYSQIARIRELLGRPPTVALTATATRRVQDEILRLVGIEGARRFHTGIRRESLFLAATVWWDEASKWDRVAELLRRLPGCGIVYGTLIQDLHRLEQRLARPGERHLLYHGDLSREERRTMQEEFVLGRRTRVLATPAFGMGIDKADVRFLLHHQVPASIEAYSQEVGRAGRDGAPSYCELLYCEDDLSIHQQFVEWANPPARLLLDVVQVVREWGEDAPQFQREDLDRALGLRRGRHHGQVDTCLGWLEVLGVLGGSFEGRDLRVLRALDPAEIPEALRGDKRERDLRRLLRMVEYVRTERCRREWLEDYFDVDPALRHEGPCRACDVCTDREEWIASMERVAAENGAEAGEGQAPEPEDRELRRGDFVQVEGGRFVGRVLQVSGTGKRREILVECSSDLVARRFRVRTHRIERLDSD